MSSKVVVIGTVEGAFRDLFLKLSKVQAKNNFSLAIITGDLFGEQQSDEDVNALLQGSISVPLPTYFGIGKQALPSAIISRLEADEDICPNLFFLGRRGTYKTAEDIRIITLGGVFSQQPVPVANAETKYLPVYTEGDARALHGAHSADIIITNEWPSGIKTGSKVALPPDVQPIAEQQVIADLVAALKPRYHLSTSGDFFYEREPFFHMPQEEGSIERPVTRFISLASFNNQSKHKWLYAFNMDTKAPIPTTVPLGVTASPLTLSKKRSAPSQGESYSRYSHEHRDRKRSRRDHGGPQNHGPESCFFCLSNPNIATHMICSIGDESYVTIAKGPLPLPTTFPVLGFPMHMLILPFAHTSKFHDIQEPSSPTATYNEMQRYRLAIYDMIASTAGDQLGAVCWEVSRKFVRHFVWQVLPIQADRIKRGLVEAAFRLSAEKAGLSAFTKTSPIDPVPEDKGDYFRLWIWTPPPPPPPPKTPTLEGSNNPQEADDDSTTNPKPSSSSSEKSLLLQINEEVRFDIQFGRKVLANLLQLENRANWQDCTQTVDEETEATEKFKEVFKGFDFAA